MGERGELGDDPSPSHESIDELRRRMDSLLDEYGFLHSTDQTKGSTLARLAEVERELMSLSGHFANKKKEIAHFNNTLQKRLISAEIVGDEGVEELERSAAHDAKHAAEMVLKKHRDEHGKESHEFLQQLEETTELGRQYNLKLFIYGRFVSKLEEAINTLPAEDRELYRRRYFDEGREAVVDILNPGEDSQEAFQKAITSLDEGINKIVAIINDISAKDQK